MNRIVIGLFCLGLIVGCSSKGSDRGKVEIQLVQPEQKVKPDNEYTFSIKAVAVEGKGFKGKVTVAIETPEGVSVDPKSFEIDLSEKGANTKDCTLSIDAKAEKGSAPKFLYGHDLRVRPGGKPDFGPDTPRIGVEVFQEDSTKATIAVSENGSLAVIPAGTVGGDKTCKWLTAHDMKVRKAGEAEFTQKTKVWGAEVFRDQASNHLLYVCESGSLAFAPAPFPKKRDRAQEETKRLEGRWRQVSGQNVGVLMRIEPGRMTFSGWASTAPGARVSYDLTLEARKSPPSYAIAYPGRNEPAFLGIYKLEGDTLTLCSNLAGHGRPTAFEGPGRGSSFEVYRRVKR